MESRRGSCDESHGIREEVETRIRSKEERTLPDRFKRAFRPRRTCSSKLYKTSLHASATSLSLSLSSRRTYRFVLMYVCRRIYIYTFTNTRMADAPRPRYATSSSLSLSDRLNPRPAFLFKPRAFGYGTGFESFVGSTVAASTVFARRNYSTNFLHFQSREY